MHFSCRDGENIHVFCSDFHNPVHLYLLRTLNIPSIPFTIQATTAVKCRSYRRFSARAQCAFTIPHDVLHLGTR